MKFVKGSRAILSRHLDLTKSAAECLTSDWLIASPRRAI